MNGESNDESNDHLVVVIVVIVFIVIILLVSLIALMLCLFTISNKTLIFNEFYLTVKLYLTEKKTSSWRSSSRSLRSSVTIRTASKELDEKESIHTINSETGSQIYK